MLKRAGEIESELNLGTKQIANNREERMNDLVQRLSEGRHVVEVGLRPEKTVLAFKECLDRGWVYVKFTGTRGGTELGVKVDSQASDLSRAEWEAKTGEVKIVGYLTLNYEKVKCVADISLESLAGYGHLEPLAA